MKNSRSNYRMPTDQVGAPNSWSSVTMDRSTARILGLVQDDGGADEQKGFARDALINALFATSPRLRSRRQSLQSFED